MNQLEKLDRWIEGHESEMTEFLVKMLQIPSVTGQEGDIQSFMAKTLAENGMVVDVFEPSVEELRKHRLSWSRRAAMRAGRMWSVFCEAREAAALCC